jgi:hypothetical protein
VAKHFDLDITDTALGFARKTTEIAAEAATDGVYVVRTSLPAETFDDATTVRSYKSLAMVKQAFRCIKTVDLQVRPVYHRLADRVRAHVLTCSSNCSWFGRMADWCRQDLRRLRVWASIALHDTRSNWKAIVPAVALAA